MLYGSVSSATFAGSRDFVRRVWRLLVRPDNVPPTLHQLSLRTAEGNVDVAPPLPNVPRRSLGERGQSTRLSTWSLDPS
ncbi:hypothetical protein GW17_00005075 [Ensete ventricosum]|nr:hypothetical protein GW17_00005075 [Ensete ventricosum]